MALFITFFYFISFEASAWAAIHNPLVDGNLKNLKRTSYLERLVNDSSEVRKRKINEVARKFELCKDILEANKNINEKVKSVKKNSEGLIDTYTGSKKIPGSVGTRDYSGAIRHPELVETSAYSGCFRDAKTTKTGSYFEAKKPPEKSKATPASNGITPKTRSSLFKESVRSRKGQTVQFSLWSPQPLLALHPSKSGTIVFPLLSQLDEKGHDEECKSFAWGDEGTARGQVLNQKEVLIIVLDSFPRECNGTVLSPQTVIDTQRYSADNRDRFMGTRNTKKERLHRLETKTLDANFVRELKEGMNCSNFEAHAILELVKETYLPFFDEPGNKAPPGKITLMVLSADEPAGKPLADCEQVAICLSIHNGPKDDQLQQKVGSQDFRRAKIPELCQEALSQGGLLTREDLAYHIFFCSPRTISRDLAALRKNNPSIPLPLRSIIHDIGPVLTHRVEIVRMALQGKTTTEIRDATMHSPEAISNYISTFTRCAQLAKKEMSAGQISFLLRRGRSLIESYLDLLKVCQGDKTMDYHLEQLLKLGSAPSKKK